jgi:hypothetical protein
MSAVGFYLFYLNARPIPEELLRTSGLVASAEKGQRPTKRSIHTVWFTLEGSPQRFAYPGILPRIRDVWENIEVGSHAVVIYTRNPGPDGRTELWGLSISGVEYVGPIEARAARLKNGYFSLALGFAFAGGAAYTWRQAKHATPT